MILTIRDVAGLSEISAAGAFRAQPRPVQVVTGVTRAIESQRTLTLGYLPRRTAMSTRSHSLFPPAGTHAVTVVGAATWR
ncbi:hypothetical protein GCM10010168_89820 [Actinoplanes ianthinogenes]|uniref:Uncharacterized protein n=1 Tax=Actinoplanes ianthinogenes TaxID=122358 RepID=A0ABM7M1U4_9ACTN|nr:hypothetical protein Aiant_62210 [Actinoplanes ianthinogenes]GGR56965.1 hypothetical protein GCM10010168_89820 [Actinoplanes ianthinogenes]